MEDIKEFNKEEFDKLIEEYFVRKTKAEEEKKQLEALNKQIVAILEKRALTEYNNDKHSTKLTYKCSYKYKDEAKLLAKIKGNKTLERFIVTSVDTKALTEHIKNNPSVATELKDFYEISGSTALSVK